MTLARVAEAVDGELLHADPTSYVDGPVVVDSRQMRPGGLFAAFAGDHVDGHEFVQAALDSGAVAALTSRPVDAPCVVVRDVRLALADLARHLLDSVPEVEVVGVTGSAGKTGTKDLIGGLLARLGPTIAPEGSFNNEIGLPLTVLRADGSTRFLVLEMGARGVGHVAELCAVAPPRIGVVLNVGTAHLGEFGSRDAVARAKGELVESLPRDGVAVLNTDDDLVASMADRTDARVVTFGLASTADVRAVDLDLVDGRPRFDLVAGDQRAPVHMQMYGEHQASNALAAAAVALEHGMTVADVADLLSAATPLSRWRMEVVERGDGVTVINDAYNANPESVRLALKTLVSMGAGRRTWAVLGEMRELGPTAADEHDAIGRLAVRLDVSRLVAVGKGARAIHLGASHEGSWGEESAFVDDVDAAIALVRSEIAPGDVVLVKASRAVGLERVALALLDNEADVA